MRRTSFYIINGITIYRIAASVILFILLIINRPDIFKWFLAISFFTDAIDGFLARKYRVSSVAGAKLDSIGDDLTVVMGVLGLVIFKFEFISQYMIWLGLLLVLFAIQVVMAFKKYGGMTSFHTYLAKLAAIVQGTFLILAFFMDEPNKVLFFLAVGITAADLAEEIILVYVLPVKKENVKGLYWVMNK
jgi:CDP-diacylglycerol--glycerol-3-phosphate 3-phosphatidyltransferase